MLLRVVVLWRRLVQAFSSGSVFQILTMSSSSKDDEEDAELEVENDEKESSLKSPCFNSEKQVTVLLFQECDWKGRKLLFDSKSLRRKENSDSKHQSCGKRNTISNSSPNPEQLCPEQTEKLNKGTKKMSSNEFQTFRHGLDARVLEEMIFGTVPMTYWGTTMKVHSIRSPPQLMISVVFPAPVPNEDRTNREKDLEESGSWHHSSTEIQISKCPEKISSVAHSVPVDVPVTLSVSNHRNHNRYVISDSLRSTGSNSSFLSLSYVSPDSVSSSLTYSGSYNSLQRRWLRNMATSIEFGLHHRTEGPSSPEEVKESSHRKVKLGLSIIISLDERNSEETKQFQEFFFSHITIIESHVFRLKNIVSKAYLNRKSSVAITCEGIEKFRRSLQDLYTAPRLSCPMWLTRMLPNTNQHQLCLRFLKQFITLLDKYEKKETNFFVSTLLTAVLTHHLAWVPTVTPSSVLAEEIGDQKNVAQWLEMLAKSHPYNPLWMQLGDMYGSLGFPNKLARTIITGKRNDVINNFLFLVSYFIRCSGIWEQVFEKTTITDENLTPVSATHFRFAQDNSPGSPNNICSESGITAFPNSYFPKRRYSLQQDFNKWTQYVPKEVQVNNCILSTKLCEHILPNTFDWKAINSINGQNGKIKEVLNYNRSNGICPLYPPTLNSTEDTVFYLDENLPSEDQGSINATLPSVQNLSGPLNSLGYTSMDDMSNKNQIGIHEEIWNHNIMQHVDIDKLRTTSTSHHLENKDKQHLEGDYIGEMQESLFVAESSNGCDISNTNPLKSVNTNSNKNELCLCSLNLKSVKYNASCDTESVINCCSCQRTKECMNPESWHQCKVNSIYKCASDDCLEEGYHSMEEAKTAGMRSTKRTFSQSSDISTLERLSELQLPKFHVKDVQTSPSLYRGCGWSLLAGTSSHYMTDFCLQGIKATVTEDEILEDLQTTVEVPVLGEPLSEAIGIIADTDKWKVKLISSNRTEGDSEGSCSTHVGMSSLVADMCESVLQMYKLGMPPELCMIHLEDRLQELYFRSRMLAEYLCSEQSEASLSKATTALGLNPSDGNLLIAVASTHTPQLAIFNR